MSEKEKQYMPQSTAGLIRYFDVEEGIKIKPQHVVAIGVGFAAIVIILKFLA
ncbi:preprotein translocase subunit Sec61beta [archaeon]|nr:preprotein translocase subunit Sec61beta [archaeon]